jgi:hypothetical protein
MTMTPSREPNVAPSGEIQVEQLLEWLRSSRPATFTKETARAFRRLHRIVDALPLATADYCFAHNWIASAERLWAGGDSAPAQYQIDQVIKKLGL